ncbi:hypothetical protein Pla108_24620 [Botrimarina colliarenosi]|uniref:GAF domain-containing protein n=1 Tax=Botrimarina colliarenosi TaxID=2528001 RepID=A0A5C6ABL1_9BACT|nr:GAF domain-containing protein [Botrimarina colliarenosi]TWT96688.1 hypothetical protein Pla108_24620 [Botrimarina colliarenosi]
MSSEPLTTPKNAATPSAVSERIGPVVRAVLRGAAKGLCHEQGGFQAAELWLLDEASRGLGLASRWARKDSSFAERPATTNRPLAKAPADVAALAGGAVVVEEPADAAGWDLHAGPIGAAICLPVSSDTTIHGVLWLMSAAPLTIADEAVELAEIVAGRLALEVERAAAGDNPTIQAAGQAEASEASDADSSVSESLGAGRRPTVTAIAAPPVEAAAWTAPHAAGLASAGVWELPGGRLFGLAVAAIDSPDSTTASQRSAVEWLVAEAQQLAPRAADAGILLTLLNRRLLESPLAGEGLAVTAVLVDAPEDADAGLGGSGTWAFAGPTVNLSVRAACTTTHSGDLVPLGWSEHEAAYAARPFDLAIRERLVLTAGDPRLTSPLIERRLGDIYRAVTADAHRGMTPEGCLRRLAASGADDVLAAVALRRA